jgi:hypothetical protein
MAQPHNEMTQEQKRIKIAEACGWTSIYVDKNKASHPTGIQPRTSSASLGSADSREIPDYFNDLNAMHEVEKKLPSGQWTRYCQHLAELGNGSVRFVSVHSSAANRAEAFGKTLNLW